MARVSRERLAQIAITVQFLALVRTGAEFFRLRAALGPALTIDMAAPFVVGSLLAAVGAWAATTCYFLGRYRTATVLVGATIIAMLAYKFLLPT
jgi:hypothetical protein